MIQKFMEQLKIQGQNRTKKVEYPWLRNNKKIINRQL